MRCGAPPDALLHAELPPGEPPVHQAPLGQVLLGQWGLSLAGVYIIQTFIGSLVLIIVAKWVMKQLAK